MDIRLWIMSELKRRIAGVIGRSIRPALGTSLWILKWIIPITLATSLLNYFGVIAVISEWFAPLFSLIGLSGESALVFITSALANIYSAIAVMASVNMDLREVTIMAVMCLICHNMILETVIQRKAGASPWVIVPLRIVGAIVAAYLLNIILPTRIEGTLLLAKATARPDSIGELLYSWGISTLKISGMVIVFITILHIIQNLLREFRIIDYLTIPVAPVVRLMGLSKDTSFLWIVANTLGLAYGGGILIRDIDDGTISTQDARLFNTHIAFSHSLLEDTILFAAIGVGVFWLIVPRIIIAFFSVRVQRLFYRRSLYRETKQILN